MINLTDKLKRAQLRRQGANARSMANIGATSTLLKGGASVYKQGESTNWTA